MTTIQPTDSSEQDHDRRTDETIERIVATGEAFFGGTTWRGKRCMRISVCARTSIEPQRPPAALLGLSIRVLGARTLQETR